MDRVGQRPEISRPVYMSTSTPADGTANDPCVKSNDASTIIRATYYGSKKLRRTKIGGCVYWAESALDDWIASCTLGGRENMR